MKNKLKNTEIILSSKIIKTINTILIIKAKKKKKIAKTLTKMKI